MTIPSIKYAAEVRKKYTTYWPAWVPTEQVEVGAFGELQYGIHFKRLGNVAECGVTKKALEKRAQTSHGNIVFKTRGQVRLGLTGRAVSKIPVHHIPPGHVGARVTFERAHAAFLAGVGVKATGLKREQLLRRELTMLLETGKSGLLEAHHVVVTDVLKAQSGHAFISTAAGQAVTLHAKAGLGAGKLDLAHVQGTLQAAFDGDDLMAFDGEAGMTPLFKIIGFKVGRQIRDLFRSLRREPTVIRLRVKSLGVRPAVDTPLVVSPLPAQQFVIAPTGARAFSIDASAVAPFAVRPAFLDARVLDLLVPPSVRFGDIGGLSQAPLIGTMAGELGVDDQLSVRPVDATPAIIEPVDSEPFLVSLTPVEELTFGASTANVLDEAILDTRSREDDSDPYGLDYVDFDAELDATADELDID